MTRRRTRPGMPIWAMLAGVWAMLVLGAVPVTPYAVPCGQTEHGRQNGPGHAPDCLACCPCTLAGLVALVATDAGGVPAPRGGFLGMLGRPPAGRATVQVPVPARARGPPVAA